MKGGSRGIQKSRNPEVEEVEEVRIGMLAFRRAAGWMRSGFVFSSGARRALPANGRLVALRDQWKRLPALVPKSNTRSGLADAPQDSAW